MYSQRLKDIATGRFRRKPQDKPQAVQTQSEPMSELEHSYFQHLAFFAVHTIAGVHVHFTRGEE